MDQPPRLHLLRAEDLPHSASDLSGQITPRVSRAVTHFDPPIQGADQALLRSVEAALAELSAPGPPAAGTVAKHRLLPEERYEEHDLFFRVVRVAAGPSPLEAFLRSQLEAYRGHLTDMLSVGAMVSLNPEQQGHLRSGFDATLALIRRHDTSPTDQRAPWPTSEPASERRGLDPLVRWILGHHSFFAMIQGMLTSLNCAINALASKEPGASGYIDTATLIMKASAAALRYAGDFSPVEYARRVRPAMMPPNLAPKFSGLQSRDHRYLLEILADLRTSVAAEPRIGDSDNVNISYQLFLTEMRTTYDEHKYVCARFGGDNEPSLRMNPSARIAATTVLERMKHARTQAAGLSGRKTPESNEGLPT